MNSSIQLDTSRLPPNIEVKLYGNELIQESFTELFQKGCVLHVRAGATIREIVTGPLRIQHNYLDNRIKTIFLNGQAVDNVEDARVGRDAVLSLSASMPGFVGAALRKGGFYAAMRGEITHCKDQIVLGGETAKITVRLYNIVARELGPRLLRSGIQFPLSELLAFFTARSEYFWRACRAVMVNNLEVDAGCLKLILGNQPAREALVLVQVINDADAQKDEA